MLWYVTAVVLMAAGVMFMRDGYLNSSIGTFLVGGLVITGAWVLVVVVTILFVLGVAK